MEGKKLTVTLLSGQKADLEALFKEDHIDPAQWAKEHRRVEAVVANEELRSYNPPVDRQGSRVVEYQSIPTEGFGCGGVRWVIEPELLLEGFRKGRIIRLFVHPAWPVKDMPFGESLYDESFVAELIERNPNYYPYRTDFANKQLPWYQLKPGEFPPHYSEHRIVGELVQVDKVHRSGQFRSEGTNDLVSFTLPPFGGSTISITDQFDTRNNFFGGQVGLRGEVRSGRMFVEVQSQVALGVTNQIVDIHGSTAITPPGGVTAVTPVGFLASGSNSGRLPAIALQWFPNSGSILAARSPITSEPSSGTTSSAGIRLSALRIRSTLASAGRKSRPIPGQPPGWPGTSSSPPPRHGLLGSGHQLRLGTPLLTEWEHSVCSLLFTP